MTEKSDGAKMEDMGTGGEPKPIVERRPMDADRAQIPHGQVHVIPARCKECGFCVRFCPEEVLIFSNEMNAKGYHYPTIAENKVDACVHCGFCNLICPELAIYTEELDAASSTDHHDGGLL